MEFHTGKIPALSQMSRSGVGVFRLACGTRLLLTLSLCFICRKGKEITQNEQERQLPFSVFGMRIGSNCQRITVG